MHLKRFNCVNNKWVKSQKVVNFPFQNFDPAPYLASVPQETILRHKELLEHQAAVQQELLLQSATVGNGGDIAETDADCTDSTTVTNTTSNGLNGTARIAPKGRDSITTTTTQSSTSAAPASSAPSAAVVPTLPVSVPLTTSRRRSLCSPTRTNNAATSTARRKRLVSTSLTQTPVIDGEFTDFHKHLLVDGQDPYDLKYRLYAVVVSVSK